MRDTVLKSLVGLSLATSIALAGGYKIPEQSLNSTALSAAYVANANGADAAYFNPANMVWNENVDQIEGALTYIYLPAVEFDGSYTSSTGTAYPSSIASGKSKVENFYMPNFHYSSKEKDGLRYGFSMTSPAGLSKRWDSAIQKSSAEEFTLKTVELNPTIAKRINNNLAIGAGLRMIYSEGVVKSSATAASRDMEGDSIDFGWNVALSYKPEVDTTLSATYRSKIELTEEGKATLSTGSTQLFTNIDTSVMVPVPAALNLAIAKKIENTTYEFVYEKTYWSAYNNLDFEYTQSIAPLTAPFDDPKDKLWKDTNTYKLGITHQYSDNLKLMFGFAIDETPIPDNTLGFELPGSDGKIYSCGFEKKLDENRSFGMAYLFSDKESRTVSQTYSAGTAAIDGTFTEAAAHLVTIGYKVKF